MDEKKWKMGQRKESGIQRSQFHPCQESSSAFLRQGLDQCSSPAGLYLKEKLSNWKIKGDKNTSY